MAKLSSYVKNNRTTTVPGFILDARVGMDISNDINNIDFLLEIKYWQDTAPLSPSDADLWFTPLDNVLSVYLLTGPTGLGNPGWYEVSTDQGKIYVKLSDNSTYRWSGSTMVSLSSPLDYTTQAEVENVNPTENTKVNTILRIFQAFKYWMANVELQFSLLLGSMTTIGAINKVAADLDALSKKRLTVTTITENYTATVTNDIILLNPGTSGAYVLSFPLSTNLGERKQYIVKNLTGIVTQIASLDWPFLTPLTGPTSFDLAINESVTFLMMNGCWLPISRYIIETNTSALPVMVVPSQGIFQVENGMDVILINDYYVQLVLPHLSVIDKGQTFTVKNYTVVDMTISADTVKFENPDVGSSTYVIKSGESITVMFDGAVYTLVSNYTLFSYPHIVELTNLPYTVTIHDDIIIVPATAVTSFTLPTLVQSDRGKTFTIMNQLEGDLTVNTDGTPFEEANGSTSLIVKPGDSVTIVYAWYSYKIVSKYIKNPTAGQSYPNLVVVPPAAYVAPFTDNILVVTSTMSTLTLPDPASLQYSGLQYIVKNSLTTPFTFNVVNSIKFEDIMSGPTEITLQPNESITVVYGSYFYRVVSRYLPSTSSSSGPVVVNVGMPGDHVALATDDILIVSTTGVNLSLPALVTPLNDGKKFTIKNMSGADLVVGGGTYSFDASVPTYTVKDRESIDVSFFNNVWYVVSKYSISTGSSTIVFEEAGGTKDGTNTIFTTSEQIKDLLNFQVWQGTTFFVPGLILDGDGKHFTIPLGPPTLPDPLSVRYMIK